MRRVAIYMRVSSTMQAQEGDSIPAQRDALLNYINAHNDMICAGEYLDDGVSGTKEDRDELQRMLSDVREGKIDLILVTKLDRLYRSIRHYLSLQDTLDKCGVPWLAIWEPIYDTSTPQGRLIINQMMSIAQFEAENTGQRIRQVQAYKVSQGEVISGSTPPGYKIVNKHLVPDENADTVREMFEYYSLRGNLTHTMKRFDHTGIFPHSKQGFKALLRNTKYIGLSYGNDHFCEPIIDEALFNDVQRKLKMNVKVSQKRTYIFSGLIRCAECGAVFGAGTTTKKRKGYTKVSKVYRCSKRYSRGIPQCDNPKVIYENVLEAYLLEHIRPMVETVIYEADIIQVPAMDNKARLQALEKRLSRLKELFVNDMITLNEYKQDREEILSEIDVLAHSEAVETVDTAALRDFLAQPFEALYGTFTDDEKRYFWRSIIKEIQFDADRQYHIFFAR